MSRSIGDSSVLLDSIMENCKAIITVKDLDFNYIACNKVFFEVFKTKHNIIGKNISEVLTPSACSVVTHYLKKVIVSAHPQTFTMRVQDKIINQTITPVVENGLITRILTVSYDVTTEENLKLKFVEKICQLNTLLEYMPMLVYMNDKDCNYIAGSKYSRKFIDTGIDSYSDDIQLKLENNTHFDYQDDKQVAETKKALIKEREIKTVDGTMQWYKICKVPILDENNFLNGIVTIAQNINKEKILEAQKELFLATLTHDLKNPVQAQLLSLKMLADGAFGELNSEQKEMLDMILESSNYMQDMLQSILSTYKFDNGLISLDKKFFSAGNLMQNCINEVKAFASSKNIKIIPVFKTSDVKLFADEEQLRRVISNLINNALNYSFKNSDLTISITNDGENMVFGFKNSSPEIPLDIKENLFEKYISGAKNFKLSGMGLGLYFSKRVVEAHHGRIYLEGNGTSNKFIFEIPLKNLDKASVVW